ncbi:MAG TPA: sugar porter family MFS transporter [Terriglobales bacterium]|jgi:sugar porter (SP) family MFS transporter
MSINSYVVKGTAVGALGGLLFGFDTAVISGTTQALTSVYHLSPFMLGVTVSSALLGTVIAALGAGIPGQRYGRRASLRLMALFYLISALGCAFAWNWPALIVFRFVGGLGIGGSSVLGPMYIAEIAPPKWRGRLVGCFQINVVVGILLAYLSNYIIASQHLGAAEWRWQLGVSGFPALLFLIALFGIPRSPRWLVMEHHLDEAAAVLRRAGVPDVQAQIAEIVESVQLEKVAAKERLFSRKYAKPLFLAITVGMFCQLSGINAILYYLNDIFALAGASTMSGNLQAVAVGAMNLVATLAAMAVIDHIGRRRLLLIGTSGLVVTLAAVSVIFYTHQHMNWLVWLLLAYIACFAISQGAVIWVYVSEVFPNRVRSKGQSVGSSAHWITNAVIALVFPIMATTSGAYPFIFFTVMMVLDLFIIAVYYPETTGISLEQVQHEFGIR